MDGPEKPGSLEFIWRFEADASGRSRLPTTPAAARQALEDGNRTFADALAGYEAGEDVQHVRTVVAGDVGISGQAGKAPVQRPFAAVLGCADARAPVELILGQHANELYVVRVAGNVLGEACQGSIAYAVEQFDSLRLLVVLGHAGCGVLTAAVNAYITPREYLRTASNLPLRAIVDAVMSTVRGAAFTLEAAHGPAFAASEGYRDALIATSVALHAGLTASVLRAQFATQIGPDLDVAFGVYDLASRRVGLPGPDGWMPGLSTPPQDEDESVALAGRLAKTIRA